MNLDLICATTPASNAPAQLVAPTQALLRGFALPDSDAAGVQQTPAHALPVAAGTAAQGLQARQGFRVGSLNLMIGYADGSELAEMPKLYRLPNAPAWFCGMANLHGVLTPVFDLSIYIGVERDPAVKQMLLVLSHGANAAGVVIDGMPQRLRWSAADQVDTATAPARLAPHLRAACVVGDGLYFDLQCDALLDALEQALETSH